MGSNYIGLNRMRCPPGSRRNKKTGICDQYREHIRYGDSAYGTLINRRVGKCPRGTRRVAKSGRCSNKRIKKSIWQKFTSTVGV